MKKAVRQTKEKIIAYRTELERDITKLLKKIKSEYTFEQIFEAIYEEEELDDFQSVLMMFDDGTMDTLNAALELVNDAWNYFPHRSLGGLSPTEKILEYRKNQLSNLLF